MEEKKKRTRGTESLRDAALANRDKHHAKMVAAVGDYVLALRVSQACEGVTLTRDDAKQIVADVAGRAFGGES